MIEVSMRNILVAVPVLGKLREKPFKGRAVFVISRLLKELQAELDHFDIVRAEIIDKYALRDEEGKPVEVESGIKIQPEQQEACLAELNDILDTVISIDCAKMDMAWFEDVPLFAQEAELIFPFVEM